MFLFLAIGAISFAQIKTPSPSPSSKVTQMVGLTEVTIEYSRPGVKDREIFGGLLPFGEVWRTGANSATKITFDKDVQINGTDLKAGSYALLTKPGETEWGIMLFTYESGSWSSYTKEGVTPVLSFTVKSQNIGVNVETLLIDVNNIRDDKASIDIVWEKTAVGIPLTVHTDKEVMAAIDKTMAGPSERDYYTAAVYLQNSGKNNQLALEYMNKGIPKDNPRYWQLRHKSLLLADLGKKAEAIATAKQSLELATKAGNKDYIRMNEASIAEWSGKKIMKKVKSMKR